MPSTNPGPASQATPNATAAIQAPPGPVTAGRTFATLPTGQSPGEVCYTTDQGLCYWNGSAWLALGSIIGGTIGPIASLAAGTVVGQLASTTDAGVVYWNGSAWVALDGAKDSQRLLAVGKALNVNQIGDIGILPLINSSRWNIQAVVADNLTSATAVSVAIGIMTVTNGGAYTIVAPSILSGIGNFTTGNVAWRFTVQNVSVVGTGSNIFVNCQTTAGTACTLDVFVYGYDLSI